MLSLFPYIHFSIELETIYHIKQDIFWYDFLIHIFAITLFNYNILIISFDKNK